LENEKGFCGEGMLCTRFAVAKERGKKEQKKSGKEGMTKSKEKRTKQKRVKYNIHK
jgi:hypothetical protein